MIEQYQQSTNGINLACTPNTIFTFIQHFKVSGSKGKIKMGWFSSNKESKTENTGQTQNNITVIEPVSIENWEILAMLGIICFIKVVEFLYFMYRSHTRHIKKKCNKLTTV